MSREERGRLPGLRSGVRVGVDVGAVRIGVARSDASGSLAVPVETVDRRLGEEQAVQRIRDIAHEYEAMEVLVGHPLGLDGRRGKAADDAETFAAALAEVIAQPIRLVDERLSTVQAQADLHRAGRTTRSSRSVIDQQAAVILVQQALDVERSQGRAPGRLVTRKP